jgi:hypothetical protein
LGGRFHCHLTFAQIAFDSSSISILIHPREGFVGTEEDSSEDRRDAHWRRAAEEHGAVRIEDAYEDDIVRRRC